MPKSEELIRKAEQLRILKNYIRLSEEPNAIITNKDIFRLVQAMDEETQENE